MDGKTKMNGNGRLHTKMPDVAGSVSGLTHDVVELSELQARLFMLDVKQSSQRMRASLVLAIVGICVLLGTIPVALLAIAQVLVEQLEWSQAAALGVATLLGLAVTAGVFGAAYGIVKNGLISLERSREELNRNIAWFKSTLRSRGGSSPAESPSRF
jgi:cytochrome c biogenesis protein CcdA